MSSPKQTKAASPAKNDRRKKAKTGSAASADGDSEMQTNSENPFPVKLSKTEKGYCLAYNIVYVSNMERSFKFYTELFGVKVRGKEKMDQWVAFDTGTTALALHKIDKKEGDAARPVASDSHMPGTSSASWFVPDIKAFHKHAKSVGAEVVRGPEKQIWGGTTASYRDPDGGLIEIAEAPVDAMKE